MNREPIKDPVLIGCLNCSSVPKKTLPNNYTFQGMGVHFLEVIIDEVELKKWFYEDEYFILKEFNKKYKNKLKKAKCAEIKINTPLHNETYEYNIFDGKWYLVEQGMGYA